MKASKSESTTITLEPIQLYVTPKLPDGGYGWVIVFAAFCNNLIADGLTFSFGILYLELNNFYKESHVLASIILSLFNGIPLLMAPVTSMLTERFSCKVIAIFGSWLTFFGFFLSYFTTDLKQLFITIGILAPMGLSCLYLTSIVMVSRYFDKKRALATGIAVSGSGMGGILFTPLIQFLCKFYELNGSFLILSAITLNGCVFGLLLKPISVNAIDENKAAIFQRLYNRFVFSIHSMKQRTGTTSEASELRTFTNNISSYLDEDIKDVRPHMVHNSNIFSDRISSNNSISSLSTLVNIPVIVTSSLSFSTISKSSDSSSSHHYAKQSIYISGINPYIPQDHKAFLGRRTTGKQLRIVMETLVEDKDSRKLKHQVVASSRFHAKYWLSLLKKREGVQINPLKMFKWFLMALFDFELLRRYKFVLILINNFLVYLSYPIGYNQLPSYAVEKNNPYHNFLPVIIGISNCISQILMGVFADFDIIQSIFLYSISIVLTGVSCIMLSLFDDKIFSFLIFSVVFGITISANFSLCSVILVDVYGLELLTNTYGFVLFVQGIGSLLGPPIVGKIKDVTSSYRMAFVFSGTVMIISSLILIPPIIHTNKTIINIWKMYKAKDSNILI